MEIDGNQETEKSADHEKIAMREIDHGQDAIDHSVAQGNQGVDAAQLQSVQKLLKDIDHKVEIVTSLLSFPPFLKEG